MSEIFKVYWNDLNKDCKSRLWKFLGNSNGGFDKEPLLEIENVDDDEFYFEEDEEEN